MIVDIDQAAPIPLAARYDACIAGGGVAGIVLAFSLARRGRRILVLEAGGLEFSDESQSLYRGTNVGHDYFDLDASRLRFLGGTSNHWGGWCRPLDAYDFEALDHIERSGWPIDISDLEPYLPEARDILEIAEFPPEATLGGSDGRLKEIFFRWSPPVRFGEKYGDFLAASESVDVFLNANLIDIELDPDSGRVAAFLFRGYGDGAATHRAVADEYALALGGIENARILLNVNRQVPRGVGNGTDLVGRFFMEHPHYDLGVYVSGSNKMVFGKKRRFIAPTVKLMRDAGIANAGFRLQPIIDTSNSVVDLAKSLIKDALCASDVIADLFRTIRHLRCPNLTGAGRLTVASQQVPNANSRVTLSEETDRLGLRRVVLDWQLTPLDKKTMRVGAMEIAKHFALHDIGRVKLFDWVLDEDDPSTPSLDAGEEVAGNHHMGTTRMGVSRQDGVVDANCRVFGVDNLYIAGSSVFPTVGHANPTLTIVQLTLRLADHLAGLSGPKAIGVKPAPRPAHIPAQ